MRASLSVITLSLLAANLTANAQPGSGVAEFDTYLSAANADLVCDGPDGARTINPKKLIPHLFRQMRFSLASYRELDRRVTGLSDDELQLAILTNREVNALELDPVDPTKLKKTTKPTRIDEVVLALDETIRFRVARALRAHLTTSRSVGRRTSYPVSNVIDGSGFPAATRHQQVIEAFYNGTAGQITCPDKVDPNRSLTLSEALRLRGNITSLHRDRPRAGASAAAIRMFNADPAATFSFTSNELSNETNIAVRLSAGFDIGGYAGWENFSLVPFVFYERNNTDGGENPSTDINTVVPGITGVYSTEGFFLDVFDDASFTVRPVFDLEQDAETLRLETSTRLNRIGSIQFNEIHGARWFIRPQLTANLIADLSHVFDAGESEDLADDDDDQFFGLGGDVQLRLFLNSRRYGLPDHLDRFSALVRYRGLGIVAGDLENQSRFTAQIAYAIPGIETASLAFSYEDGENIQSFQDERLLRFSLGLRF